MAKSDWEPFFEEFTDIMLEYYERNDVPTLIEKIRDVFRRSGVKMPICGRDRRGNDVTLEYSRIDNLDPFTILTFMVDGRNTVKKNCISAVYVFHMRNLFPENYDKVGIPLVKSQGHRRVSWYFEDSTQENIDKIQYLWDLFEATVQMRRNYNTTTKDKFVNLYNHFLNFIQKDFKVSSITDLLMLVAPRTLIGLNEPCQDYIKTNYPLLWDLLPNNDEDFDGKKYLELCDDLVDAISTNEETLGDVYYKSYEAAEQNKGSLNGKEQSDLIIGYINRNSDDFILKNKGQSANCNCATKRKDCYWLSVNPERLKNDWYVVLYDDDVKTIRVFTIAANSLSKNDFQSRFGEEHMGDLNIYIESNDPELRDRNGSKLVLTEFPCKKFDDVNIYAKEDVESEVIITSGDGSNIIYYGIPGCGKSYHVNEELEGQDVERIVFHPDYSYSDFVGQIVPSLDQGKVVYKFNPGPFTRILGVALKDAKHMHYLVIEELNRGNAPAIFGDLFQLLDRDENHQSRYCVANADIQKWLLDECGIKVKEIRIPANLSIYATMNTSDQNVFPLDTAFQRRWSMQYVPDDIDECEWSQSHIGGPSSDEMTWKEFHDKINDIIKNDDSIITTEDKRLGAYFCSKEEIENAELFSNKVLKYLWDDAFKLRRNEIFGENIKSFEDIDSSIKANSNSDKKLLDGILTTLR